MEDEELDSLESLVAHLPDTDPRVSLMEDALDCVMFAESVYAMFRSLNRVPEYTNTHVKNATLEKAVDQLSNELTAAVVFLAGLDVDVSKVLRSMGDAHKKHQPDPKVGDNLSNAYTALADIVDSIKSVTQAKKSILPTQQKST